MSPIPWPLWIGGLFPVYVTVVSVLFWFLRGSVWPVQCATLGFVLAWAATSAGVSGRSETWLKGACLKALKWWAGIFVPVGLLNLAFTVMNKSPA
ncbi:hypothetical protein [Nocardia nova]|uniref:hypothetical protein n=1 Tax=Nocardia nova TaxID=37330 RepID=UPI0015E45310|nr:hypothetical protein [Nocardia nova]